MNIFDLVPLSTRWYWRENSIILFTQLDNYYIILNNDESKTDWKNYVRLVECGLNGNISIYSHPQLFTFKEFFALGPTKIKQKTPVFF